MSAATIEGLVQKARQAIEQRDWTKAKMMYLQALGLKSDMPDLHYGMATVYFQLRELTSAAHHFKEVTRLDPLRAGRTASWRQPTRMARPPAFRRWKANWTTSGP